MTVNIHMSEPISNKEIFAHIASKESIDAYHKKLDNAERVRNKETVLAYNKSRSEQNELMLKAYHERIDRLLTYNQYATVVKPLMEQGKIINLEA